MSVRHILTGGLILAATALAAAPWSGDPATPSIAAAEPCGGASVCALLASEARVGQSVPDSFDKLDPMFWGALPEPEAGQTYYTGDNLAALVDEETLDVVRLVPVNG